MFLLFSFLGPNGGDCSYPVAWNDIQPKFGWWKIPEKERIAKRKGRADQIFQQCLFPPACLGAANTQLINRHPEAAISTPLANISCNVALGFKRTSRLCHSCRDGFKRQGTNRCAKCPENQGDNWGLMFLGFLTTAAVATYISNDAIDGAGITTLSGEIQKIFLNFLQVITLFSAFPLQWPPELEGLFEFQGAISTVGEHLVNPDCASHSSSAVELYYAKQMVFALLPFMLVIFIFIFWFLRGKIKKMSFFAKRAKADQTTTKDKFVMTLTSIIYLLYPTLCKNALSLFDCKSIGGVLYLKTAMEEPCYVGRHASMLLLLGVSQLLVYVFGLPFLVLLFLSRNRDKLDSHVVMARYGLFYAAYKPDRYYWETIITVRKVGIVLLSVFGPALGPEKQAQVALLIFLICIVVEIFGDAYKAESTRHNVLNKLELSSLLVAWWTMWSGLMIYQLDKNDPMGFVLSMIVIVFNSALILWFVVQFVKAKIYERKKAKREKKAAEAAGQQTTRPSMLRQRIGSLARIFGIKTNGEITAEDGDVQMVNVPDRNPMYRPELSKKSELMKKKKGKTKSKTKSTRSGKQKNNVGVTEIELTVTDSGGSGSGKLKKQRRLSSRELMEAEKTKKIQKVRGKLEIPADDDLVTGAPAAANSNGTSNKSIRRSFIKVTNDEIGEDDYFQDIETEETVWEIPVDGDLVTGAAPPPANSISTRMERRSFIKVTNDEIGEDDYFQDIETEETVWEIPVDGDLVTGATPPAAIDNSPFNGSSNKSIRRSFIKVTNDEIGEDDYFQDIETEETVWEIPVDGDLVTGAAPPPANSISTSDGTSNKSKRRSFIKVTNDEIGEDDYFQNIETGEFVWEIPADGDLITM